MRAPVHGDEPAGRHTTEFVHDSETARTVSNNGRGRRLTARTAISSTTRSSPLRRASACSTASTRARPPTVHTIARNAISYHAGADLKAAGGPGLVEDKPSPSSMFGLVVSLHPAFVTVAVTNLTPGASSRILSHRQHAPRAVRLWNQHAVSQTGRSTCAVNASAVLHRHAARLTRATPLRLPNPDLLGSAFLLNDSRSAARSCQRELVCDPYRNAFACPVNGATCRVASWRASRDSMLRSVTPGAPPAFSGDGLVTTSANLGRSGQGRLALGPRPRPSCSPCSSLSNPSPTLARSSARRERVVWTSPSGTFPPEEHGAPLCGSLSVILRTGRRESPALACQGLRRSRSSSPRASISRGRAGPVATVRTALTPHCRRTDECRTASPFRTYVPPRHRVRT